jgi:hypothetical protein
MTIETVTCGRCGDRVPLDVDHVDLGKVQVRRFTFEDGVISYDATHPHVTHEDEMEGEIDV